MHRCRCAFITGILLIGGSAAVAATPGQVDDFEDGTTQASAAVTSNTPTGRPAGANDNYLPFTSTGTTGGGSRLLATNTTQWFGAFTSIRTISMDLKNTSGAARPMRLALRASNGDASTPGYASTTAFNLPDDGNWHQVTFNIDASSLTAINSPPDLATFLLSVGNMRIL